MLNKNKIFRGLAGLGFFLILNLYSGLPQQELAVAIPVATGEPTGKFQKIEQPKSLKILVALAGLGLIGLELWWFMFKGKKY